MSTVESPVLAPLHPALTERGFFRLSVKDYHELGNSNILTAEDRVELIDGYLVKKQMQKSPHSTSVRKLNYLLNKLIPERYLISTQLPITLEESEPEPDISIVRGDIDTFALRHPNSSEVALVIEVSNTSLVFDREVKGPIYGRAGIPEYVIVNIPDRIVEVYTQPKVDSPTGYANRRDFTSADSFMLQLDGVEIGKILVASLLP